MGNCQGKQAEVPEVKVLLLGSGGCGKTTFVKQMKLNFSKFSSSDETEAASAIQLNGLKTLKECIEGLNLSESERGVSSVMSSNAKDDVPSALYEDLIAVSKRPDVLDYLSSTHGKSSSQYYFVARAETIYSLDYVHPSSDDILRCRIVTRGMSKINFTVDGSNLCFIDVGGQRSQRRVWTEAMAETTAVVFVASLEDYMLKLEEDPEKSRIKESLEVFERVFHSPKLRSTPVILLLNKVDLFNERLTDHPVDKYFPDYKGPTDEKNSLKFIATKYAQRAKSKPTEKQLNHIYPITSTDSSNFLTVFESIREELLQSGLTAAGLI